MKDDTQDRSKNRVLSGNRFVFEGEYYWRDPQLKNCVIIREEGNLPIAERHFREVLGKCRAALAEEARHG
jgi:hypothetical protein